MFWEKPGVLKNYQTKATTIFFRVRRTLQGNRQPRAKNKKEEIQRAIQAMSCYKWQARKHLVPFFGLAPFCYSQATWTLKMER